MRKNKSTRLSTCPGEAIINSEANAALAGKFTYKANLTGRSILVYT